MCVPSPRTPAESPSLQCGLRRRPLRTALSPPVQQLTLASYAPLATRQDAYAFNQPLSFDTSSVKKIGSMFREASAFNQQLSFDTSSVTTMSEMFYGASAFNQPLSFDTSKVTTMYQMFLSAGAFNQPLSFDTSSVRDMGSMFWRASVFNQPLSFDTSSVTNMRYMFNAAPSLSDANKLLIRCAWTGTPAFTSAYGPDYTWWLSELWYDRWGLESCA